MLLQSVFFIFRINSTSRTSQLNTHNAHSKLTPKKKLGVVYFNMMVYFIKFSLVYSALFTFTANASDWWTLMGVKNV